MTPEPECKYCGGAGYYIGGDEWHVCFCVRDQPEADDKELDW